jgi:hypothetical protein
MKAFEKNISDFTPRTDWCREEDYHHVHDSDVAGFADEWLRRNSLFLADLRNIPCLGKSVSTVKHGVFSTTCAETCPLAIWGVRCCRADIKTPTLFWLSEHIPHELTLELDAVTGKSEGIYLNKCPLLTAVLQQDGYMHLLFKENAQRYQAKVQGVVDLNKPVSINCTLQGIDEFGIKFASVRRFHALYKQGRFIRAPYSTKQRRRYMVNMLRAWDGKRSGAKQREIAEVLLGSQVARDNWDRGARAYVQRLLRSAKNMIDGEYLNLLHRKEKKENEPGSDEN